MSFYDSPYTTTYYTKNDIANIAVVPLERVHYDWTWDSTWFTYIFQLIFLKKHNIQNIWYVQAQCSLYYPLRVADEEFLWTHGFLCAHGVFGVSILYGFYRRKTESLAKSKYKQGNNERIWLIWSFCCMCMGVSVERTILNFVNQSENESGAKKDMHGI